MCLQKWLNARGNVDWAIWKIHSPALPYISSTFLNPEYIQRYNILDMSGQHSFILDIFGQHSQNLNIFGQYS